MKKFLLVIIISLFLPFISEARDSSDITDWYVKNFQSQIEVKKDSSLIITESILADCGNLVGKHGIFRTLPFEIKTNEGKIKTPVKLISITDFSGNKIPYSKIKNNTQKTITWKIGDPDKTVTGENEYRITYEVQNAIRFQKDFEEFYWNLSGNFWGLEIDNFTSDIILPSGISQKNTQVDYYVGETGSKEKEGADFSWKENVLSFQSKKFFLPGEGITVSVSFPQGIFTPYVPSFWEKYGFFLPFFIPFLILIFAFSIWKKYGRDPKWDKTIIPEFDVPDDLSPVEICVIEKSGGFKNEAITASLIDLAVSGIIKIEKIEKKGIFGKEDYNIILLDENKLEKANKLEKSILQKILGSQKEKKISELKNKFQVQLRNIKSEALDSVVSSGYLVKAGSNWKIAFLALAFLLLFSSFPLFGLLPSLGASLMISAGIILIFSFIMPKRTLKGAEANWKIQGFKLYMETAEKHRQQFNEKENIFEKFLPYAIVFGMTKLWVKKMKEIYGENYFDSYHPLWYVGIMNGNFDVDTFTSSLESVSSSIASNVSSSSGASGGGFSGGGGGGGGGGGW